MDEVRRSSDHELCGHVAKRDGTWSALTVFGTVLGEHGHKDAAMEQVLTEGLACLAERWTLRHPATGTEEIVCILEANPSRVTVARGYYALPGVPTLTISAGELAAGEWVLER